MANGRTEIVVTGTRIPVLRAGAGLIALPIGGVLTLLLYQLTRDAFALPYSGMIGALIGAAIGLAFFGGVAARLTWDGQTLCILRSLDEVVVRADSIVDARVTVLRASRWIAGMLWVSGRRLPVVFHFAVLDRTSIGDFDATARAVERCLLATSNRRLGQ